MDCNLLYMLFTKSKSAVYFIYLLSCSNNNNEASALLYNGLLVSSAKPFGTNPHFILFVNVCKTSFAISNLFGINNSPSKAISESLPQSKNQG